MSGTLLVLGFLLFGQLVDRYPAAEKTSALLLDYAAEVGSTPVEEPQQESPASGISPSVSDMFDIQTQDSVEPSSTTPEEKELRTNDSPPTSGAVAPQSSVQPPPQTTSASEPITFLENFSEPVTSSQLSGTPVTLVEVIASSPNRREQTQRVETYWDLSRAVLEYNLSLKEKIELEALRRGIAQAGPHWDQSLSQNESRERLALRAVQVAQQRMAQMLGFTREDQSPLPSDLPFVGTYNTRFAELFPQQTQRVAKEYDEYLTNASQVIVNEAKEIAAARDWMFAVSEQRSPQTDGKELLVAYELFAARRRLFVETVANYNREIVRYTEIATPGSVEPQRLVAMLIRVAGSPSSTVDPAVRRTSAEEQVNPADAGQSQPRTTAENSWHALPNNSERSILVPSR
ncbi:hypothetical protein [Bythopirellula polymerisocia]|uniref:Uncharacterized protein n=1 Tax=Bythopirellula polymerisocia TaxID=2528003 RepID=A0A5C6C647_9BACT|nr:hypothetical protein [Bythopirellula polymerisocia]TWU20073.1 hypothetical protein Pla144_50260 [Bythopirellula polymerisocia]